LNVIQDNLKGLKVPVNVGNDGKLHVFYVTISNLRNPLVASLQRASSFLIKCSSPESRIANRKASSSSLAPSACNSTRPSGRLRTMPVTSNPVAVVFTV